MTPNSVRPMRHLNASCRSGSGAGHAVWLICLGIVGLIAGCGPQMVDAPRGDSSPLTARASAQSSVVLVSLSSGTAVGAARQDRRTAPSPEASAGDFTRLPHKLASDVVVLREPAGEAVYHQVRQGETLFRISRAHRVALRELIDANGLDPQAVLHPEQWIYIPRPARPQE